MRIAALFVLVTTVSFSARADDVDVDVVSDVGTPEVPHIDVTPNRDLKELHLALTDEAGGKIDKLENDLKAGTKRTFPLSADGNRHHYQGLLTAKFADKGGVQFPLVFDTSSEPLLLITYPKDPLDEAGDAVRLMVNRTDVTIGVKAVDVAGKPVGEGKLVSQGRPAGEVISVPWKRKSKEPVAEVVLDVVDPAGFQATGRVVVFKVDVPHEEVLFDTAKHDLRKDQQPKLDAVIPKIRLVLEQYRKYDGVRLWIAGHTDTMDDRAYNQALSERRARTIAQYFRTKGLTCPMAYAGFGETRLAVPTPDETPEQRNRRAQYILSIGEPMLGSTWTPLP